MKKMKVALLLTCIILAMGGCTKESDDKEKGIQLTDLSLQLDNEMFTIYEPLHVYLDTWDMGEPAYDLEPNEEQVLYLKNKKDKTLDIQLHVYNAASETKSIRDAVIIDVGLSELEMKEGTNYRLPNDFRINETTEEEVRKALGIPHYYSEMENTSYLSYASDIDLEKAEVADFSFKDGKLQGLILTGSKDSEEKKTVSFDTAKVLGYELFEMPLTDGNFSKAANAFEIDGININKETSLLEFTDKGWSFDILDTSANDASVLMEKDKKRLDITVSGRLASSKEIGSKHTLIELFIPGNSTDVMKLSSAFQGDFTIQDVYAAFQKPSQVDYRKDNIKVKYEGHDVSAEFTFNTKGNIEYYRLILINDAV